MASRLLLRLVDHLRANKHSITKTISVPNGREPDPTYGNTDDYEVVDFDQLMVEIEAFAKEFES